MVCVTRFSFTASRAHHSRFPHRVSAFLQFSSRGSCGYVQLPSSRTVRLRTTWFAFARSLVGFVFFFRSFCCVPAALRFTHRVLFTICTTAFTYAVGLVTLLRLLQFPTHTGYLTRWFGSFTHAAVFTRFSYAACTVVLSRSLLAFSHAFTRTRYLSHLRLRGCMLLVRFRSFQNTGRLRFYTPRFSFTYIHLSGHLILLPTFATGRSSTLTGSFCRFVSATRITRFVYAHSSGFRTRLPGSHTIHTFGFHWLLHHTRHAFTRTHTCAHVARHTRTAVLHTCVSFTFIFTRARSLQRGILVWFTRFAPHLPVRNTTGSNSRSGFLCHDSLPHTWFACSSRLYHTRGWLLIHRYTVTQFTTRFCTLPFHGWFGSYSHCGLATRHATPAAFLRLRTRTGFHAVAFSLTTVAVPPHTAHGFRLHATRFTVRVPVHAGWFAGSYRFIPHTYRSCYLVHYTLRSSLSRTPHGCLYRLALSGSRFGCSTHRILVIAGLPVQFTCSFLALPFGLPGSLTRFGYTHICGSHHVSRTFTFRFAAVRRSLPFRLSTHITPPFSRLRVTGCFHFILHTFGYTHLWHTFTRLRTVYSGLPLVTSRSGLPLTATRCCFTYHAVWQHVHMVAAWTFYTLS